MSVWVCGYAQSVGLWEEVLPSRHAPLMKAHSAAKSAPTSERSLTRLQHCTYAYAYAYSVRTRTSLTFVHTHEEYPSRSLLRVCNYAYITYIHTYVCIWLCVRTFIDTNSRWQKKRKGLENKRERKRERRKERKKESEKHEDGNRRYLHSTYTLNLDMIACCNSTVQLATSLK